MPSGLPKCHNLLEALTALQVCILDDVSLKGALLLLKSLEFFVEFIVPVLEFGHVSHQTHF